MKYNKKGAKHIYIANYSSSPGIFNNENTTKLINIGNSVEYLYNENCTLATIDSVVIDLSDTYSKIIGNQRFIVNKRNKILIFNGDGIVIINISLSSKEDISFQVVFNLSEYIHKGYILHFPYENGNYSMKSIMSPNIFIKDGILQTNKVIITFGFNDKGNIGCYISDKSTVKFNRINNYSITPITIIEKIS